MSRLIFARLQNNPFLLRDLKTLIRSPHGVEAILKLRHDNPASVEIIDAFLKRKNFLKKLKAFGFQLGWNVGYPPSRGSDTDANRTLSRSLRYLVSLKDAKYQRALVKAFTKGKEEGLEWFWDAEHKPQHNVPLALRVASRYMRLATNVMEELRYLVHSRSTHGKLAYPYRIPTDKDKENNFRILELRHKNPALRVIMDDYLGDAFLEEIKAWAFWLGFDEGLTSRRTDAAPFLQGKPSSKGTPQLSWPEIDRQRKNALKYLKYRHASGLRKAFYKAYAEGKAEGEFEV